MIQKPTLVAVFTMFAVVTLFANSGLDAQDQLESKPDVPDAPVKYEEAKKQRLYDQVITKLEGMSFAEASAFKNDSCDDEVDWFVVGGTLTHKTTGALEANFNTFQGVEKVAEQIVEFQFGSYGSQQPAWRVFDRFGGKREAERAMLEVTDDYDDWAIARNTELARQNQIAAAQRQARAQSRARSRSRSRRRGGC